jgi:hypothetical protein
MTSVCPNSGPSQAKPPFAGIFAFTSAAAGALLSNKGLPYAAFFAGFLGLVTYDLSTFCPSDPPADPGMTGADYLALLGVGTPVARQAAILKFEQLVGHYLWWDVCECVTGTASPVPPAIPAPPGMPQVNPPVTTTSPGPAGPCWQGSITLRQQLSTDTAPPAYQTTAFSWAPGINGFAPFPCTFVIANFKCNNNGLHPGQCRLEPSMYQQGGSFDNGVIVSPALPITLNPGQSQTITLTPHATNDNGVILMSTAWSNQSNADNTVDISAQLFCTSQTQPLIQCCLPDPNMITMLQDIDQLVTLLQRQDAPFAYILGTAHSILSGHGVLTIQGLLGAKIELTTTPSTIGSESGSPLEIFGAGWIAWGTADGFISREVIHHNPQLSFPAEAGQFTQLGYSLTPGVVATITEITREP